jgi:hypothetical protein
MGYEWATTSPVKAGLDGPSQLEEGGAELLWNARWIYAEDSEGQMIRSDELQQRQSSIQQLGERCHVIQDEGHIPRKNASKAARILRTQESVSASLREWPNPPLLFDEEQRSVQFVEVQSIPVPNESAGFGLFVRKELYEHRLDQLNSQILRAVMAVNVREGLKWLEAEGHWFDIVEFMMGFLQASRPRVTPSYAF